MIEQIVIFNNVTKNYPLYHHITGGIKRFLFNMPEAIRSFKNNYFRSLEDISFSIERGECFGIMGRSGAGKSTILGLIAGVLKPSEGTIIVNERVSPLLELGAGFHNELTGKENIELNGVLLGLSRKEVLKKMPTIIDFSEIGAFIDQPIRTYSSGTLARLGFSIVAHLDPKLLLIDEVLAVGDAGFQEKCKKKMQQFRKEGVTMVLVSHSTEIVEQVCDRAMWIDQHVVKKIGTPSEVAESYKKAFSIT
jgi:lipopolysaccharide transport system ATP-binding protein